MTPLRQRMLDAMVLRGMAARTQEAYIGAVVLLARHYDCVPDTLTAQQVQDFLLHLRRDRARSTPTLNQYGCAFRFLYGTVLGLDGAQFQIPLAAVPQRLPQIFSREEIARLFAATRRSAPRAFLMLAYGSGLRLSELCHLRVSDIDSHADRMCIRVEQGKGAKDRFVPLAPDVLAMLRDWWPRSQPRPRLWLFPGQVDGSRPLNEATAQKWYYAARDAAGITKRGGIHMLRHCYATHTLESGVDLFTLSRWLGHNHVSTTSRYLHLARPDAPEGARRDPLQLLSALAQLGATPQTPAQTPAQAPAQTPAQTPPSNHKKLH